MARYFTGGWTSFPAPAKTPGRGPTAALRVAALLCLVVALLVPAPGGADSEPRPRPDLHEHTRQVLSPRYQTELPEIKVIEVQPVQMGVLPDFFTQAMLVLAAIIVAMLVFNIVYSSRAFENDDDPDGDGRDGQGDLARLRIPDPDDLAAGGRYAEAIHALLLRALVEVARRCAQRWPRSLTSREILRNAQLTDAVRQPLAQLVQRVETHHFGGIAPAEADFTRCREIYSRLQDGLPKGKA